MSNHKKNAKEIKTNYKKMEELVANNEKWYLDQIIQNKIFLIGIALGVFGNLIAQALWEISANGLAKLTWLQIILFLFCAIALWYSVNLFVNINKKARIAIIKDKESLEKAKIIASRYN